MVSTKQAKKGPALLTQSGTRKTESESPMSDTIAPETANAIAEINSLEDLEHIAAQRRYWNAIYGPAARKLVKAGKATNKQVADVYGIKPSTASILIRDAA